VRDVDLHNQYAVLTIYICLQTTNQYLRDQILYSILWKVRFKLNSLLTLFIDDNYFFNSQKNVQETQTLLKNQSDPDDMLKELQVMRNNNNNNNIMLVLLIPNCVVLLKRLNLNIFFV